MHFPTDLNLLWDAGSKCVDWIEKLHAQPGLALPGWRKANMRRDARTNDTLPRHSRDTVKFNFAPTPAINRTPCPCAAPPTHRRTVHRARRARELSPFLPAPILHGGGVTSDPTGPTPSAARLEQFRTKAPRQRIHPTEKWVLYVISAQLVLLPWALGGMKEWAQWVSFGLSVLAFGLALLPRDYDEVGPGQAPFRLYTWPKLLRFPIWWLGLALLGYIVIQALNPAWIYETDGKGWWMKAIPHQKWLPSGVDVPFERWGPWRMLLIYASVLLSVCALWIGLTRRRSLQLLFTVLATNAFFLAILGIAQRATGADKIFWFWRPPASYFVSSFIYKNHAGAYFNLLLALCSGLALWHYERGLRRLDKSSPAGLFAFFATAIVLVVVFSYSRTATLLLFAFLLVAVVVFIWRQRRQPDTGNRNPLLVLSVVIALGAFLYLGFKSLRTERFLASLAHLQNQVQDAGLGVREVAAQATWEMAKDKPVFGWGAGSFRFCFPIYQHRYPEIVRDPGRYMYWDHAHNDYVELASEFGLAGSAALLALGGFLALRYLRADSWRNPVGLFTGLGLGLVVIHAGVDFHAYNPAILTTACALAVAAIRWSESEEAGG